MASNRHEKCSYGKYKFKDEKQAKFVPTAECYGLDDLETVKTSTVLRLLGTMNCRKTCGRISVPW